MSDDNILRILEVCTQKMAQLGDTIKNKESTEVAVRCAGKFYVDSHTETTCTPS